MSLYYIYKYEKDKNIYYIGQSINLKNRIKQHQKEAKFQSYLNSDIYYFECNSKLEMDSYEYFLINKYHPILNKAYNCQDKILNITEPKWKLYNKNTFGEKYNQNKDFDLSSLKEIKTIINKDNSSIFTQFGVFEQKLLIYMFLKCNINNINFNEDIPFSVSKYLKQTNYYTNSGKLYTDCQKVSFIKQIGRGQYIFNFPKNVTNAPFFSCPIQIIKLFYQVKCKYTIPLFELIFCYKMKKINRDFLINFLTPNLKSYRNNFKDFERSVLSKALNEINIIFKSNYTYEKIYTGRKITDLVFYLKGE